MFNVILYYSGQYGVFNDNTYKVCEDVYSIFEMLTAKYEYSFRDEASITFLKNRSCSFIKGDRYAIREKNDRVFPITYCSDGTTRKRSRITPIIRKIEEVWREHPDLRLGQLLIDCVGHKDLFNLEDDELMEALERFGDNL